MNDYNPKEIEPKWQQKWLAEKSFSPNENEQKRAYVLDMFPYPSGAGLHVGHPEGYTATDIFSRYTRMRGLEVLHPMGWDAFGLPAENYAIKTGVHPAESTATNIHTFRRQIQSLGFSYDWDREINTSSPEYYKWTQWLFTKMFEAGLVYRKKAKVNWCDGCQTVLANEQVEDGKCERSKDVVIQKDLEQWFFKITDYAEQLLDDLDTIDWPEPLKLMQKNWIGRSEGAELSFDVDSHDAQIAVFTTRPDTLFGATYMVLAPEHPLVQQITTEEQRAQVAAYVEAASRKTDLERTGLGDQKTGVNTGAYAVNPANGDKIPVWIADYVLATYGTGAIMAVPAHDERDWEFAKQFELPLLQVVDCEGSLEQSALTGEGKLINSGQFDGLDSQEAKQKITEHVGGTLKTQYRLRDWLISRQRYWGAPIPIVYDPEGTPYAVREEHLPLLLPTDVDYQPKGTSPIGTSKSHRALAEKLYGKGWRFEVDTMDTFVCSSWYYLRFTDPKNTEHFASTEAMKRWLPVNMYVGGAEHAVLHLLYARFFHKALQDIGLIPKEVGREPFQSLRNQGMILGEDNAKMSKSVGNVVNPDDVIEEYGADTLRMYEMFMGPFEETKPWNTASIKGVYRFLDRVWKAVHETKESATANGMSRHIHKTVKKVTADIEKFGFNTAISEMMIFLNKADYKSETGVDHDALKTFLTVLHPFAPHMTSELWEQVYGGEIADQEWPSFDEAKTQDDVVTVAVQVAGKVRDTIEIAVDATEEEARALAEASANVQKHLEGKHVVKFIYVPGKIVNIVVK